jgi:hypothetical protein
MIFCEEYKRETAEERSPLVNLVDMADVFSCTFQDMTKNKARRITGLYPIIKTKL